LDPTLEADMPKLDLTIPADVLSDDAGMRVWVLGHEIPEGSWGAAGQIFRFAQLREAAKAEREKSEAPA
jgi:hypothetical protein